MNRKGKIVLGILAGAALLVGGISVGVGNYFVNYALVRAETGEKEVSPAPDPTMRQEDIQEIARNREIIDHQREKWVAQSPPEVVEITSRDGLKLSGDVFAQPEGSSRWVILVHGYNSRRENMRNIGSFYAQQGYQVLLPDMRSHGQSEGTYIGMGWLDRMDILQWVDFILERDPQAEIVLHGVSMGASTVLMTAGEELPVQVKAVVEDCGYTSVWDIFEDELDYLFDLPSFPVLDLSSAVARVRAGYDLKEASALEQVKKSQVPILFIHGDKDTFVHLEMVYSLYEAAPGEKELLVVEGAGHGEAYLREPEAYFQTVFFFLERYITA